MPTRAVPSPHSRHWGLDPSVHFLNHGSFGATPLAVLDEAERLRRRLEAEPVDFFLRHYLPLLDRSRRVLADFLHADPEGLVFVSNATTGVNAVLHSVKLAAGDELLVTDHVYNACRNALLACGERWNARVVVAKVPFPLKSPQEVVDSVARVLGPRTRLALIDHVTSPTGLVLPVPELVALLHSHGVDVLIDGAHAPGMLDLDIGALAPAWYVGNCHKWLCAPKGAGFLWARADWRERTRPAILSHGANAPTSERSRFWNEFDWIGTDDPAAWLCVADAIEHIATLLPGGWPAIQRHDRALVLEGRAILCAALGVEAPAPESMIGSLAAVPIPDGGNAPTRLMHIDPLQEWLWREHRIEVPISTWPAAPKRLVRISAQLYNARGQYEDLALALREALGGNGRGAKA
jgi:isopenicillin-N epimerase